MTLVSEHDLKETIATHLEGGRARTLGLVEPFTDDELKRSPSKLMSPLVWDLGHCANYEELWLLRNIAGHKATDPVLDDIYNAFEHPRWERPSLPLLGPAEARGYMSDVRGKSLDVLESVELSPEQRLLDGGYVYGMVVQHEHMHDETMLATIQLMQDGAQRLPRAAVPQPQVRVPQDMVFVDAGPFEMGTSIEPWAFDNERPAHTVDLPAFRIDRTPVTNAQYLAFMEAGGYDDPRHWTEAGWTWRTQSRATHPGFWRREGGSWVVRRYGELVPIGPSEPVQHVSWFEADAFARWAGKRLPTEAEWEKAASWSPDGRKRRFPWGDDDPAPQRANVDQRHVGPAPVGAYADGVSAYGCHQMIGDVWEWTSSDFQPYAGYEWFPYREYSEVFFGTDYKVLRGGSWATHTTAIRNTFRNWDYPIRRQIFCGFRCANDA
ncbi:MAG TPA: ergothioneine biosynthesis protein EgtB [Actinomycetota bacterium]|jgi:iron(II)-dependent oxidoreductase|nr:ergothioneine biosynthesis protein EgtB [Actinomycetota bacterium]